MPKNEKIENKVKARRLNVTFILLIIPASVLLCISSRHCFSGFNIPYTPSSYLFGLIFALIGLTWRSFLFQNDVDYVNQAKKEGILPLKEQHKIIHKAYFLKYPLLVSLYSVISVSLIHLVFVKNADMTLIHIMVLILATNILVGLKVEYPKLF